MNIRKIIDFYKSCNSEEGIMIVSIPMMGFLLSEVQGVETDCKKLIPHSYHGFPIYIDEKLDGYHIDIIPISQAKRRYEGVSNDKSN